MLPAEKLGTTRSPQTRSELEAWIRERFRIPAERQAELLSAIDGVFTRHQRLWQESKEEAIQALSAAFAEKIARFRTEISARDATVSSISRYFEDLVTGLTEKSHRDPKTKLMNFDRFMEQVESFLELEQRGRWCAIGLVDITDFKWYNDTLGHPVGDQIIERVADVIAERLRSEDVIATEREAGPTRDLHARFGGDEFCFLITDLPEYAGAYIIADRFKQAVERYSWTNVHRALAARPVKVDVGMVCLSMGQVADRRAYAKKLAADLIREADRLMYGAKGERALHVHPIGMRVQNGRLIELADDERTR